MHDATEVKEPALSVATIQLTHTYILQSVVLQVVLPTFHNHIGSGLFLMSTTGDLTLNPSFTIFLHYHPVA
jgi:hypothetical protein